jgi:hypothetical protein
MQYTRIWGHYALKINVESTDKEDQLATSKKEIKKRHPGCKPGSAPPQREFFHTDHTAGGLPGRMPGQLRPD